MLFFLRKSDGSLFYLLKNKEYTVGRKECDILITNDQSISRKHAILKTGVDNVIIRDCGSRYNTFVDNTKVEANTEVSLQNGNAIRFGALASNYTFQGVNIITTTSSTRSDQKTALRNNIDFLGGSLVLNWNPLCTHVTAEEIVLTVKVLCAIIAGTPIVTLKYWEDYVNNVKQNLPSPNVVDYKPPCSEMILNYQNIDLDYKEERRSLFKDKIFVFPTKREKDKMIDMIKLAGGEAISWDTSSVTKDEIINSSREYIILQTSESDEKPNNALLDVMACIMKMGKRGIPLQEIALAIITCSCEKDCNPSFDRKGTVLAIKTQTQSQTNVKNILANATESQQLFFPVTQDIKTETVIPQSLDMDLKVDTVEIKEMVETPPNSNIKMSEDVKSVKREGDSIEDIKVAKKFKTESTSSTSSKQKKTDRESLEIKNESEEKMAKKSLFAFKNDIPSNEEASPGPSNMVVNPFAKKRKQVQNDEENAAKRPNQSSSFTSSGSSLLTPRADPISSNSFLKPRNSIKPPAVQQKTTKSYNVIASSTVNNESLNSLELDISRIEAVDSGLERSFGWISKISSNKSGGKKQLEKNGSMEEVDEEILKYIESFKNTIIIEEEPLVVRKPSAISNNNDDSCVNNNNAKNFKRFKKVKPLKEQTRIVSNYVDIVCNNKSSHQVIDEPDNVNGDVDGDDDDMGMRITGARKRVGRNRFQF